MVWPKCGCSTKASSLISHRKPHCFLNLYDLELKVHLYFVSFQQYQNILSSESFVLGLNIFKGKAPIVPFHGTTSS